MATELYKVRRAGHGENIIHAPATSTGWYSLEITDDGTLIYRPVKA